MFVAGAGKYVDITFALPKTDNVTIQGYTVNDWDISKEIPSGTHSYIEGSEVQAAGDWINFLAPSSSTDGYITYRLDILTPGIYTVFLGVGSNGDFTQHHKVVVNAISESTTLNTSVKYNI